MIQETTPLIIGMISVALIGITNEQEGIENSR